METALFLPYHELLKMSAEDGVAPEQFAVFVPEESGIEFSYASELVSHDTALSLLLALDRAVEKVAPVVSGRWASVRSWLSARVGEVWEARGTCPGLGAALTAFGVHEGVLLAFAAQSRIGNNEDPWPVVDAGLRDPASDREESAGVSELLTQSMAGLACVRRI